MRPVDELGAAACGDRAAGLEGQGAQHLGQPAHDRRRLAVRVGQKHLEAADALDQGGRVAPPEAPAGQNQVVRRACAAPPGPRSRLTPVAEPTQVARRRRDGTRCCSQSGTSGPALPGTARAARARAARAGATTGSPSCPPWRDEPVDRLLAGPRPSALDPQTAGDLLGRPSGLDPIDDLVPKIGVSDQLAVPGPRRTAAFILVTIQ